MATTNVDILVSTKGVSSLSVLDKKLQGSAANASKLNTALNGLKGAAAGLAGLAGLAVGVGAAFDQIKKADSAAAALRSIGADTKELIPALTKVRQELNNNASQAELTKSAFEVLQAGFKKTSDVSAIVAAATTAAKAKLADTGVVTKALTAVLNSYGIEASKAGVITNKFFKTIKDGNLTIEEYSNVIGRLTPLGAAAGVELAELNAALAKVTQTGQNAAETSTGIAAALKALIAPSAEAKKLAGELGLEFGLAAVRSKGFGGVLKDVIDKTGGNTEQLQKLFGSIEALRVVLALAGDDFEGFDKALKEQKNGLDAVKKAFDANADTIAGSLTRVANAFTGLLTSGSGLARVLIPVFDGLATAISALQGPIGVGVGILGGLALAWYAAAKAAGVYAVAQSAAIGSAALTKLGLLTGVLTQTAVGWTASGAAITKTVVAVKAGVVALVALKAALIALPLAALAKLTFDYYKKQADLNRLLTDGTVKSTELKDAVAAKKVELEAAAGKLDKLRESSTSSKRALEAQRKKVEELRRQLEALEGTYNVRVNLEIAASQIASDVEAKAKAAGGKAVGFDVLDQAGIREAIARANGTYKDPSAQGGGGGGGGGGGAAPRESQLPILEQELALKQRLFQLDQQIAQQRLTGNENAIKTLEIEKLMEESAFRQFEIAQQKIPAAEIAKQQDIERLNLQSQIAELNNQELQNQQDKSEEFDKIMENLQHQVQLANETNDAARDLLEVEKEIAALRERGVITTQEQANAYKSAALNAKGAARKGSQDSAGKQILGTLKSGLGNVISTALKGGDVRAAIEQLGNQLIDKAVNILLDNLFNSLEQALMGPAQAITEGGAEMAKAGADVATGAADQVAAAAEGAAAAAIEQAASAQVTAAATQQMTAATTMVTAAGQQMAAAQIMAAAGGIPGFAAGGRPPIGKVSLVGEKGPELFVPDSAGTVISNEDSQEMITAFASGEQAKVMDRYSPGNETMSGEAIAPANYSFNTIRIADEEYVSREQLQSAMATASATGAKQGEQRAMNRLRQSRSTRSKLGI